MSCAEVESPRGILRKTSTPKEVTAGLLPSPSTGPKKTRPRSVIVSPTGGGAVSSPRGEVESSRAADDSSPPVSPRTKELREAEKKAALHAKIGRLEQKIELKRSDTTPLATTSSGVEPDDAATPSTPGERPAWWFDKEEVAQRANSPQVRVSRTIVSRARRNVCCVTEILAVFSLNRAAFGCARGGRCFARALRGRTAIGTTRVCLLLVRR